MTFSTALPVLRATPRNGIRYLGRRLRRHSMSMWRKIQIELHSHCNRDCSFCPRSNDRSGVRKDSTGTPVRAEMPTQEVFSILDQAHDLGFRGSVGLHRLSEATLDPRFLEVYEYIRKKGMFFCDATNGDVLKRRPDLCAAIDHEGTGLTIGLYDSTTEEERNEEKAFWRSRFKNAGVSFSEPDRKLVIRQGSRVYELAEKDPAILEMPCYATDELLIRYDGNVSLCCQDDLCTFHLGSVFERSLEDIWWSPERATITRKLRRPGGRRRFLRCSTCYAGYPSIDMESNKSLIDVSAGS